MKPTKARIAAMRAAVKSAWNARGSAQLRLRAQLRKEGLIQHNGISWSCVATEAGKKWLAVNDATKSKGPP